MRGRIVPPIHHPSWRLVHADLNWDVPATMLNYLGMDGGIQVTKAGEAILRVYRKRSKNGERIIRVEEGVHPFRNASCSFNESIGETIVEAASAARKELITTMKVLVMASALRILLAYMSARQDMQIYDFLQK